MKNRRNRFIAVFTAVFMIFNIFVAPVATVYAYDDTDVIWFDDVIRFDKSTGEIMSCAHNATSVIIPDEIEGVKVTSIGDYAFSDCSLLTSVTIPNGVTSIGEEAFYGCSSLTSVTIPNSVKKIGSYVFSNCKVLKKVIISNGVKNIEYGAFNGCKSLTSVTIPKSVKSIGEEAFSDCSSLTSVTIPNSVTKIGKYAFSNCLSLISVTIPKGVTIIDDYAFSNCKALKKVIIPNGVTYIGSYTFKNCSSLTSITIPNGTYVQRYAFYNCKALKKVIFLDAQEWADMLAFWGCKNLKKYYRSLEITSLAKGTKSFTVKWKWQHNALPRRVTGYQIQYSTSSTFASGNKIVTVTSDNARSKIIKNLKAKKKYYVRVRTYKIVNGVKSYCVWSEKKSVTTK